MAEIMFWIAAVIHWILCAYDIMKMIEVRKEQTEATEILEEVKKLHARAFDTLTNINRTYFRRIHGHWQWETTNYGSITTMFAKCSNCGDTSGVGFPYCPHCGAQMDEEGATNV